MMQKKDAKEIMEELMAVDLNSHCEELKWK